MDEDLFQIFESYPEFKDVFQVRALRRYHYMSKIKRQYKKILLNKFWKNDTSNEFLSGFLKFKRARLVEEFIPYNKLVMQQIGSEDEFSIKNSRETNLFRREQRELRKAKFLQAQIQDLKAFSMQGMIHIIETLRSLD